MYNMCGNIRQTIICAFSGNTVEWRFYDRLHQHDFTAVRDGNRITITGTFAGARVEKTIDAGMTPWFQEPGLQAFKFITGGETYCDYIAIIPSTLETMNYSLIKSGDEPITMNAKKTVMLKVENKYSGVMSAILVSQYWFKKNDGLFAVYKGPGLDPLARESMMRLLKESK